MVPSTEPVSRVFIQEPTEKEREVMAKQKREYNNDGITLHQHLRKLSLEKLEPYLVWVRPEELHRREPIGQGGFAVVEKATVDLTNIEGIKIEVDVALKNMKYDMISDLKNELLLNVHLRFKGNPWSPTPHIIGLSMIEEPRYSLVMQYVAGGTLENFLLHTPPQNWKRVHDIAVGITERLLAIHEAGLVHCDIHPGNVVFDKPGPDAIPLLIDVGASKLTEQFNDIKRAVGRFEYLSPEFFRFGIPDQRYDVYGLGILLWQLTARYPPRGTSACAWQDGTGQEVTNPSAGLREMPVPGTPTCYKEIFLDCWETNPLDRPTTADVLRRLRESEETLVASPWFNAVPEATTYFAAREAEYLEKTNRSNAGSVVTSSSAFTYESFTFEPASLSDDELGEMDSQEEEKRDEDNEEMGNEPQESSYERIVTMSDRSDDSQEEEESDEYDDDGTVTLGYEDDGETVALGNDHEKSQGSSERRDHSRSRPRQRLSTDYDDDEEESDEDDRERVILGDEGDKSQESSEDLGHDMVCKDTVETTVDADPTGGTADKTVIEDVSSTTEETEIVEAGVAVAGDVGSVTSQVVSVELDMDHMKAAKYSRVNKGKSIFWRIASSIKDAAVTAGHAIHILRPHYTKAQQSNEAMSATMLENDNEFINVSDTTYVGNVPGGANPKQGDVLAFPETMPASETILDDGKNNEVVSEVSGEVMVTEIAGPGASKVPESPAPLPCLGVPPPPPGQGKESVPSEAVESRVDTQIPSGPTFQCLFDGTLLGVRARMAKVDSRFRRKEFVMTVQDKDLIGAIPTAVVASAQSDGRTLISEDTDLFFGIPNDYGIIVLSGFARLTPPRKVNAMFVLFRDHMDELRRVRDTGDRVLAYWSEEERDGAMVSTWEIRLPNDSEMNTFVGKYMRKQRAGYE